MIKPFHDKSQGLFFKLLQEEKVLEFLDPLKIYHEGTYHHSLRVGLLSIDLGVDDSLSNYELTLLGYSGLLHDIGKMDVPIEILFKNSPLDSEERKIMQPHPRSAFEQLRDFEYGNVGKIVVGHHEYKKEYPYPRNGNVSLNTQFTQERRKNDKMISTLVPIVAVADAFDAFANRSHNESLSKEKIENTLLNELNVNEKYINQVLKRYV